MSDPATRARERVLEAHAETVEAVLRCADDVAAGWDQRATTDRREIADPLRRRLGAAGAWERLPEVLADAADAAGFALPATPVADPPYVAVASRGPVLRATVSDGRLVVLLRAFDVERGDPIRYVRGPETSREAVRTTLK